MCSASRRCGTTSPGEACRYANQASIAYATQVIRSRWNSGISVGISINLCGFKTEELPSKGMQEKLAVTVNRSSPPAPAGGGGPTFTYQGVRKADRPPADDRTRG